MALFRRIREKISPGPKEPRVRWKVQVRKKTEAERDERQYVEQKHSCPMCHRHIDDSILKKNLYVCPGCDHHFPLKVKERIATVLDPGTFNEVYPEVRSVDPIDFPGYREKLDKAQQKSGTREGIVTGVGKIEGRGAAVGFMSFAFMGGSMGVAVGEKVARLMRIGIREHLPVVLFTSSGGARMQEGIFSLMQMAKTSHAAALLEQERLPFFIVLTHPTTGGVTASFAMLGNVILAEPGALIGFAGPRVIESTIKQKLPEGFQRAEFQQQKGFVDAVVHRKELKSTLAFLIDTHVPQEEGRS
jgi:acetyl-CoA carboxylase carboxyl transferase subunit beta